MKKLLNILLPLMILGSLTTSAELCEDFQIYAEGEEISSFGIDSTGNWWVVSTPFPNLQKLIVSGVATEEFSSIGAPIFSRDGNRWVSFGEYRGTYFLVNESETVELLASAVGDLLFTADSKHLVYSYFQNSIEYIVLPERTIQVSGKKGKVFVSNNAELFAFIGERGERYVLNINGKETSTFDSIIPIGFMYDNSFVYACSNGGRYEFYRDFKRIGDVYENVKEPLINDAGTVVAALVELGSNFWTSILISDEYLEPLLGRSYDNAAYLELHPTLPLLSFVATQGLSRIIVLNTAEYSTYLNTGVPKFSSDGEDLLFAACDFDCFVAINGKRYVIKNTISPQMPFATKPKSNTIAYSTSASMNLLFLETGKMHAGMMVDYISAPIYNSRTQRYEAVGKINNRLYLLTCRTD